VVFSSLSLKIAVVSFETVGCASINILSASLVYATIPEDELAEVDIIYIKIYKNI
jgi:NifU-like protein involved in Fe-S cluster formation